MRVIGRQDEQNRTFDQSKSQILSRLGREKRTKEFDEYVKKLREDAHVTVNDAELEKVTISTGGGSPGHGGMMMGMPPGGMPPGGAPPAGMAPHAMPPPGALAAPPPAPAQK